MSESLLIAPVFASMIVGALALGGTLGRIGREFPSTIRRTLGWILLWTVIYAAIALPAVMSGEGEAIAIEELSLPALFTGHAGLTAFLLSWWLLRKPIHLSHFLHLNGTRVADLRGGLALGLRVWAFTFGIATAAGLIAQAALSAGSTYAGTDIEVPEIPEVMIWMVGLPVYGKALIVLIAMTVEEAFFRAFLQSRIGLLSSSILFALAHASYGLPTLMLGVFIVSILIGRDFAKHGRLVRCILAHGVFDAIQLLIVVPYALEQLQQLKTMSG